MAYTKRNRKDNYMKIVKEKGYWSFQTKAMTRETLNETFSWYKMLLENGKLEKIRYIREQVGLGNNSIYSIAIIISHEFQSVNIIKMAKYCLTTIIQ